MATGPLSQKGLAMSASAVVPAVTAMVDTIIDANAVDYLIIVLYFVVVLGIGLLARRQVSDSVDFFLSGRSLPAWVTGLAFISANLGAVEIMGMSANGAEIGIPTVHYFWVGAIPAMLFLGVVMMPSPGAGRPRRPRS
jgi:SSS family solute:Na+ symporter